MKKLIYILMLCLATTVFAVDTKTTSLIALTAVADADLLYIIDDVAGTATSKKITVLDLFDTIDTFAELNTIVDDKTLVNEEDTVTWDAIITFATAITLSDAATIDQSANNYIDFLENSDTLQFYFDATDVALLWSDGALTLQSTEDVDAVVQILGKDDGEKGILRVLSDGDDKYIELYNDDTDAVITNSAGNIIINPVGLGIVIGDGGDEDYTITFDGDTSDGVLNYDEDNADFEFDQDVITTGVFYAPAFDAPGAEDMDYGSVDITDHTFTTDDMTLIMDGGITVSTGDFIKIGTTQWNSADEIDGTKIKDADYGDVGVDAGGAWTLSGDAVDESHIADDGIDSEHYNDGSIDLVHIAAAAYAKDLVTTAPITGAADNIFVGAESDVTVAITLLKDVVATSPMLIDGGANVDDILPGGDADLTISATILKDLVTTAPVTGATEDCFLGTDADLTIALDFTTAWNFGAAAGSEWVNDGDPTTDTAGEIALDTTITDHQPLWQYYDGGENMTIIAIDTAQLPAEDDEIVKYDAGSDKFILEADFGEATAWDDIADPDAAATVDFVTYTQTIDIGVTDDGGPKSGLILDVTGLGVGTTDVIALEITTATNDDTDYIPLAIYDDSGADNDLLFQVGSSGYITLLYGAAIGQSVDTTLSFIENGDEIRMVFDGTDCEVAWTDGVLNLRLLENGVDSIVEIKGNDAGEKGILRTLSDGEDKYIELHHDDTDGHIITNTGDIHIEAAGGDISFADDNIATTGEVDFSGAASVEITNSTDPDVDSTGEISVDTDGANEPNDVVLRTIDGNGTQVALAQEQKSFQATIIKPNDLADATRDLCPIWSNETGMSFVITKIEAWSDTDDTTVNVEVYDSVFGNNATVDALEIASDGTANYYVTETTITSATITANSIIVLDFDDTDDPGWVKVSICGYFLSDVD